MSQLGHDLANVFPVYSREVSRFSDSRWFGQNIGKVTTPARRILSISPAMGPRKVEDSLYAPRTRSAVSVVVFQIGRRTANTSSVSISETSFPPMAGKTCLSRELVHTVDDRALRQPGAISFT